MTLKDAYLPHSCLLTDFYQFTMAAALFEQGRADCPSVFHLFIRQTPFSGSFAVAAGIGDALDFVANYQFDDQSLSFLSKVKSRSGGLLFSAAFIDYLKNLRPKINIYGVKDGDLIFGHEPILRIEGPLALCMLLETPLLNIINFQSLIATKAARIKLASGNKKVVDFGFRRAQGFDGALSATRAAFIGGIDASSNVWAAMHDDIPLSGTQAHSFIMSYEHQKNAFADFAEIFPDDCVLLLDTYDTNVGLKDAIHTLGKLKSTNLGIRLDSGDLLALSIKARQMLNQAGLSHCIIIASGDLDEYEIERLNREHAPIDVFGVGTRLVTAHDHPSLGGVYKLAAVWEQGRFRDTYKISNTPIKETWPGRQAIMRFSHQGFYAFDQVFDPECGIALTPEQQKLELHEKFLTNMLMEQGKLKEDMGSLIQKHERTKKSLSFLPLPLRALEPGLGYPVLFDISLKTKKTEQVQQSRVRGHHS